MAALLVSLAPNYTHLLAPASAAGKNVMPRVAAFLDVQPISDISGVVDADTFVRPIYAGNAMATVKSSDAKKVLTVRAASFDPAPPTGGSAPIEAVAAAVDPGTSSFVGAEVSKSERPELTAAKIVVSGGRAMGSAENFHLIEGRGRQARRGGWAPHAQPSMRATRRMTTRSVKRGKSSRRTSTSRSASPAPSSTWPA